MGSALSLGNEPYTIVGVVGPSFVSDPEADLWLPFQIDPNSTNQVHFFLAAPRLGSGVSLITISANGKWAVAASWENGLSLWDLDGQEPPRILKGHKWRGTAMALSGDGKRAIFGSEDRTLSLWELESNEPPRVQEIRVLAHFRCKQILGRRMKPR